MYIFFYFFGLFLLKGILHPKMEIMSSFTHPLIFQNLYDLLSSEEQKKELFIVEYSSCSFPENDCEWWLKFHLFPLTKLLFDFRRHEI